MMARVSRAYAGRVHGREKKTGHFWQGRYGCVAMDEAHTYAAIRYVLANPVEAGLVASAKEWPWSSARALTGQAEDGVTAKGPVTARWPDVEGLLSGIGRAAELKRIAKAQSTGRPLGNTAFLERVKALSGRDPTPRKRGPKGLKSALSP